MPLITANMHLQRQLLKDIAAGDENGNPRYRGELVRRNGVGLDRRKKSAAGKAIEKLKRLGLIEEIAHSGFIITEAGQDEINSWES